VRSYAPTLATFGAGLPAEEAPRAPSGGHGACAPGEDPPGVDATWRAHLELAFDATPRGTRLATLRHRGPLVVQRPFYPEAPAVCHAIVVHPPGGIAGGDELVIEASVAEGAHAFLTTPGAGKLYKGGGRRAAQHVRLGVACGAVLEWLPQETIVFDAANASLSLRAEVESDGLVLAWDIVTLGREASGETFVRGTLDTMLDVRVAGCETIFERGRVAGGSAWLEAPVGWRGARSCGTLVAAGRTIDDALLEAAREALAPWRAHAAVTRLDERCLVARYLGPTASAARQALGTVWALLRVALTPQPAIVPRIWAT
jgi:urease accessory protein